MGMGTRRCAGLGGAWGQGVGSPVTALKLLCYSGLVCLKGSVPPNGMLLLRDTVESLPCKLRWSQLLGVLLPVRQQDGVLLQMLMTAERGQGTLWVPLSSFLAEPVTSGGKTTKAPGALETKCDSFLLGKTRLVKVCGDCGLGVGRRGRKQRIPASATHQPQEAGLRCPSNCLPDWHVCMYVCVPMCTHVCTCMWAHTYACTCIHVHTCMEMSVCVHARARVHRCMCTCPRAHRYAYACTCARVHVHVHVHTCTFMHTHTCVCMRMDVHACAHACVYVCVHMHTCTCICACACVYTCMHVYVCVRACMYTPLLLYSGDGSGSEWELHHLVSHVTEHPMSTGTRTKQRRWDPTFSKVK